MAKPTKTFGTLQIKNIKSSDLDEVETVIFSSRAVTASTIITKMLSDSLEPIYFTYAKYPKLSVSEIKARHKAKAYLERVFQLEIYKYTGKDKGNMLVVSIEGPGMWAGINELIMELPKVKLIALMFSQQDFILVGSYQTIKPELTRTYVSVQKLGDMVSQDFFFGMATCPEVSGHLYEIMEKLETLTKGKSKEHVLGTYNAAGAQLGIKSEFLPYTGIIDFAFDKGTLGLSNYQKSEALDPEDSLEIALIKQFQLSTVGSRLVMESGSLLSVMLEAGSLLSVLGSVKTERPNEPTWIFTPDYWKVKNTLRIFK